MGALVSLNLLCQSLGAGAVWSHHTVAGPHPEVPHSEMPCPVTLGCSAAGFGASAEKDHKSQPGGASPDLAG